MHFFLVLVCLLFTATIVNCAPAGTAPCFIDFDDRYSVSRESVALVCSCDTQTAGFITLNGVPLHVNQPNDLGCTVSRSRARKMSRINLDCDHAYVPGEYQCHCPMDRCTALTIVKPKIL